MPSVAPRATLIGRGPGGLHMASPVGAHKVKPLSASFLVPAPARRGACSSRGTVAATGLPACGAPLGFCQYYSALPSCASLFDRYSALHQDEGAVLRRGLESSPSVGHAEGDSPPSPVSKASSAAVASMSRSSISTVTASLSSPLGCGDPSVGTELVYVTPFTSSSPASLPTGRVVSVSTSASGANPKPKLLCPDMPLLAELRLRSRSEVT